MPTFVLIISDSLSIATLNKLAEHGEFKNIGRSVEEAVQILNKLHEQAELGFSELSVVKKIIFRKDKSRQIIVPSVERIVLRRERTRQHRG